MQRPLAGKAHRPRFIRLRGHHQWREFFPVLEELGIEVSVEQKLPGIEKAFRDHLRQMQDEQRAGMVKPTVDQAKVEAMFPTIARYVGGYGYVEKLSWAVNGNPPCSVMMLSTDQPLTSALPSPLKLLANCLPLPSGKS